MNSATQMVISGATAALQDFVAQEKLTAIPLKVAGAFHTPFMAPAVAQFREAVADVPADAVSGPVVIANRTAQPFDTDHIVDELSRQIESPVRWAESITYAYEHGGQIFLDLSSTGMFSRLSDHPDIRYIACGDLRSIGEARHELRHAIAIEDGYDLAAHALGAIVTTRNEQQDARVYQDTVIPCYQELRRMVGRSDQVPERIIELVEKALINKDVDAATRRHKLDNLRWRASTSRQLSRPRP